MKYIERTETPPFFNVDTADFKVWSDYNQNETTKDNRRKLRSYILESEQKYLCGYCESKVSIENTHTDHKKPKGLPQYADLVFDFSNLIVSCEGNIHAELKKGDEDSETTCGHKKDNIFDESLFLDPHVTENISSYFSYNKASGKITPSDDDIYSERNKKATFMISLLQLNEGSLPRARLNAKKALLGRIQGIKTGKVDQQNFIKKVLDRKTNAFISYLDFCFASRLNK
ncbi:conserved hypothetical protein [Vibrio chagasii]|nr:conserved hypothetical protein [Vibrio chagasii]CAH6813748.1 conserved hypothetical protein [Vibrio chagasii]CAH6883284.1 conserved hypothetical protein [Vibrio chagasii]CAH6899933.1 conserved hypothetical protein [Vibrio chagasii]CAH6933000.1 conserved hypothetical protein [Vibrio chagasii]